MSLLHIIVHGAAARRVQMHINLRGERGSKEGADQYVGRGCHGHRDRNSMFTTTYVRCTAGRASSPTWRLAMVGGNSVVLLEKSAPSTCECCAAD